MSTSLSYRDTGVDIDTGDQLVENIKPSAKRTMHPEVLGDLGSFGVLIKIDKKHKNPVLVSGTNGVGTKLKLAFDWDKHNTVDIGLIAMSVNDILVQGARPLFFLDYFTCGKLSITRATDVVRGIAQDCEESGYALIDGETAEAPGMYPEDECDLAGFAVGMVERGRVVNGRGTRVEDVVLGLASNGAHSNGYPLVCKVIERDSPDLDTEFDRGKTLREAIVAPTRLCVKPVLAALEKFAIKGMAHITGGDITENVPCILPGNTVIQIDAKTWELPKLFQWLQKADNVETQEMYHTFDYDIDMIVTIAKEDADTIQAFLSEQGETAYRLGVIREHNDDEH